MRLGARLLLSLMAAAVVSGSLLFVVFVFTNYLEIKSLL